MLHVKTTFFAFLLCLFSYQHAIDNDAVCGGKGINEDFCSFAYLDNVESNHQDSDHEHVCINCPCSSTLISQWDFDKAKITAEIQTSYFLNLFSKAYFFHYVSFLNRPPKQKLS